MRFVVHIGTEKTGTTTVQDFFHSNAGALRRLGIWYSSCLGRPNNWQLRLLGLTPDQADPGFSQLGLLDAPARAAYQAKAKAQLQKEISEARDSGAETFLLSNEHCHSRLLSVENVERIRALFEPFGGNVEIICCLRPQAEVAVSLASTLIRTGGSATRGWFERDVTADNPYFNYRSLVERWSGVFGRAAMDVVPFARNRDMVRYFLTKFGIENEPLDFPERTNEALDVHTIAIGNAVQLSRFSGSGEMNMNRDWYVDKLPVKTRLSLSSEMIREINERFEASNSVVAAEWDTITLADLMQDPGSAHGDGTLGVKKIDSSFAPFLRKIIEMSNAELWLERARTQLAHGQLAAANGNTRDVAQAVKKGLNFLKNAAQVIPDDARIQDISAKLENLRQTHGS